MDINQQFPIRIFLILCGFLAIWIFENEEALNSTNKLIYSYLYLSLFLVYLVIKPKIKKYIC